MFRIPKMRSGFWLVRRAVLPVDVTPSVYDLVLAIMTKMR